MNTIYIGIILAMRVVQSSFSKRASNLLPESVSGKAVYFGISKLFAAVFALAAVLLSGGFAAPDLQTVTVAALSGISLAISSICSTLAIRTGTIVLNSLFGTAGLLVPCIAGIFWFDQPMSWPQWAGIAVLFLSAYLLIASSKEIYSTFSIKTFFLLLGSLLSNGLTMLFQMLFSRQVPEGNVSVFSFFTFAIPAVLLFAAAPLFRQKDQKTQTEGRLPKKLVVYALLLSFAVFVINQLATLASATVPPAVLFALINGGATIISAIVGAAMFRERLTAKSISGILLGVVSLVVIKAFE